MTNQSKMTSKDPISRRIILLVEDEPFVRDATRQILENAGYKLLTAADVDEALTAYGQAQCPIDLVMTDLVLPGGSGLRLAEKLRLRSHSIPVLLTSGYNQWHEGTRSDPDTHYLPKPYSRQTLLEKIEQILQERSLARAITQAS